MDRLAQFYRDALGLPIAKEIKGEWVAFNTGACELALHRAGPQYQVSDAASSDDDSDDAAVDDSNAKLVLQVTRDIRELRAELVAKGVPMGEVKSYPGFPGSLCDGKDPEGNTFQLEQASRG